MLHYAHCYYPTFSSYSPNLSSVLNELDAQTSKFGSIAAEAGLNLKAGINLRELFKRQNLTKELVDASLALLPGFSEPQRGWDPAWERDLLLFEARYDGYREREARLLHHHRDWDGVHIPQDFPIDTLLSFSNEVREKFKQHRPETLGQASRIPGITPAAVTLLHLLIEKSRSA